MQFPWIDWASSSLLTRSLPKPDDLEHYAVDIIAVHGLNGEAYTGMGNRGYETFWPALCQDVEYVLMNIRR